MITASYNAYCAITKEGDNDIWTVRPRGVVPLLPSCSHVGATVNALLGDTFSRENNTHGSRFHERDPQFASRILGAMTQSCYIGTRDIRSRVIRGLYCIIILVAYVRNLLLNTQRSHSRSQRAGKWSLILAHERRPIYRAPTYIAVPLLGPHQPRYIGLTLY